MNLKSYLRGAGLGIMLTALILMVSFGNKSRAMTDEEIKARARELGMTEQSEVLLPPGEASSDNDTSKKAADDDPDVISVAAETGEAGDVSDPKNAGDSGDAKNTGGSGDAKDSDSPKVGAETGEAKNSGASGDDTEAKNLDSPKVGTDAGDAKNSGNAGDTSDSKNAADSANSKNAGNDKASGDSGTASGKTADTAADSAGKAQSGSGVSAAAASGTAAAANNGAAAQSGSGASNAAASGTAAAADNGAAASTDAGSTASAQTGNKQTEEKQDKSLTSELTGEEKKKSELLADAAETEASVSSAPVKTDSGFAVINVSGGQSSTAVARALQSAGAIDSAAEFDAYLCARGYDRHIATGEFRIPAGASDEDIALIIMRKR